MTGLLIAEGTPQRVLSMTIDRMVSQGDYFKQTKVILDANFGLFFFFLRFTYFRRVRACTTLGGGLGSWAQGEGQADSPMSAEPMRGGARF